MSKRYRSVRVGSASCALNCRKRLRVWKIILPFARELRTRLVNRNEKLNRRLTQGGAAAFVWDQRFMFVFLPCATDDRGGEDHRGGGGGHDQGDRAGPG